MQGERYSLSQQVLNFENTLNQLRMMMNGTTLSHYLGKSIVIIVIGNNDYINNYLLPAFYSSAYRYNPVDYGNLLLNHYARQILVPVYIFCVEAVALAARLICYILP